MLKQAIVAENELTLSYKLKLKPTREQALFLEDYFIEFSKAVNFFLKAILTTMNQFEVVPNREQVTANCSLCAQVVPLQWRMKATGDMVCQRCCRASYDRKVFYATRGRKRGRFDFRDCAAKISGTDAARAYDVASDTLRGLEQRRRQLSQRIARQRQELRMWQEVLHDVLVEDEDGNLVSARFARERKPNQRTDRYVHYYWRDTRRRGRSLASIRGLIRKINKEVKRLEKSRDFEVPRFGQKESTMIKLQNTALKKLVSLPGGIALDITINAKRMEIPVVLPRGLRPLNIGASPSANSCTRRAQWFAQIVSEMRQDLENKNLPYPLLWWNKRSKSFYFIYPLVRSVPTLPPPQNPIAIGIDRGVRELAVLVALKDIRARPSLIRFFSGESLVELRRED